MTKQWYLSKTLWLQVLGIVALIVPQTAAFIAEYFSEVGMGWALINMLLRLITKDKIEIKAAGLKIFGFIALVSIASCGMLGGGSDDEGGDESTDGSGPTKTCLHFSDEEAKAKIIAEHGKSCKIGDYWGIGDDKCSSTLEKCLNK